MKILKLLDTGLIAYEDFSSSSIDSPFYSNADLTYGSSYVDFINGGIYMNTSIYNDFVFEVGNVYSPVTDGDMGGIKLSRGSESKELYEYYNPQDDIGTIPYVRVVKHGDRYDGYGSNDMASWINRGYVNFTGVESVGVYATGNTPYRLNSIKVYKDLAITITSLMPEWTVEVYKEGNLVMSQVSQSSDISLYIPNYPFTGTVKVFNDSMVQVGEHVLSEAWGGDVYALTANVMIYDEYNVPLEVSTARHLGSLEYGELEARFRVHNFNTGETTITLSIADYSPFKSWVTFLEDSNGVAGSTGKETLTLTIGANSYTYFWLHMSRPDIADTVYNYRQNECLYYLVVD